MYLIYNFEGFLNWQYLRSPWYIDECLAVITYESLKNLLYFLTFDDQLFRIFLRSVPTLEEIYVLETEWLKTEIKSRRTLAILRNEKKIENKNRRILRKVSL